MSQYTDESFPNLEEPYLEEVLEGQPRASYWRELRLALSLRLKEAISERDRYTSNSRERAAAEKRVSELEEQVKALALEEIVTQFMEDTARASLNRAVQPYRARDDEEDGRG